MKRIYHHHLKWEDYKNGMWSKVDKDVESDMLNVAIEFTGDHLRYGKAMRRVINEWKYCVEHNLTNKDINRRAWIGHAAVSLELGIPEYIVRDAWGHLTDTQRDLANRQADLAIQQWEYEYSLKKTLNKQSKLFDD